MNLCITMESVTASSIAQVIAGAAHDTYPAFKFRIQRDGHEKTHAENS